MSDRNNTDWTVCPICFEDYSATNRPTTFICGHSTCIQHHQGPSRLQKCPICRFSLRNQTEFHISYNLEEAVRFFHAVNGTNASSTTVLQSEKVNSASNLVESDEELATRLQAQFDLEQRMRTSPRVKETQHLQAERSPLVSISQTATSGNRKSCGHSCDLIKTKKCCSCSDQRPLSLSNSYSVYVDGHGVQQTAARNRWYCPSCKSR